MKGWDAESIDIDESTPISNVVDKFSGSIDIASVFTLYV
jgi:hypothetical protein